MADLNALVRQQPDSDIEAVLWLNSLRTTASWLPNASSAKTLAKKVSGVQIEPLPNT
jgi:hypothetical protein